LCSAHPSPNPMCRLCHSNQGTTAPCKHRPPSCLVAQGLTSPLALKRKILSRNPLALQAEAGQSDQRSNIFSDPKDALIAVRCRRQAIKPVCDQGAHDKSRCGYSNTVGPLVWRAVIRGGLDSPSWLWGLPAACKQNSSLMKSS
jgi:hypothetical protein